MADLDLEIQKTAKNVQETKQAVEDEVARRRAQDQSQIAKLIIWAFVVFVAILIAAVIAGTIYPGWDDVAEPAKFIMSILGSVMLPVVTLVIGYYFGKERG